MKRQGFTLVELLVVVAIIMILLTIVLSALRGWHKKAIEDHYRSDVAAIKNAVLAYKLRYGKWPIPDSDQRGPDHVYSNNNYRVLELLSSSGNLDGRSFLEKSEFKTDSSGAILDVRPFDHYDEVPYVIVFDTDYDGSINPPGGASKVDLGVRFEGE